jgi:serine/threonine protein kinase
VHGAEIWQSQQAGQAMRNAESGDESWVDDIAAGFDRAWNSEPRPRIEDYLTDLDEPRRSLLLEELLRVELERRRRLGEDPNLAEYLLRFPGDASVIEAPFGPATVDDPGEQSTPGSAPESALEGAGGIIAARYKLLEQIGEGGCGTVWLAEQIQPVRRKVALKLVKPGMDSRQVLARFDAERQALALMDHPNIAKIFDGGLTDAGRPFFVMDYVEGVPITAYCDDCAIRLSVRERLELFVQVCQAVQHAHQKGIIHRDLKPSNILIAPCDGRPVPKVIDFGLAKAMHQPLTERTPHTAHGAIVGTPLYMSPEQVQLNNLDVDTRTDIYSLGVVFYELLTGTTPLEKHRFEEAAWEQIGRIIREEEPPRPSVRLSSTETLASLAACRRTEPGRLTKLVRGELDWIAMKALEKDRNRRYETANGLARDIERYLAGDPVEARPPSAAYRLKKFVGKHRAALMVASLFAGLLVAGVLVSTALAVRAYRAESAAEAREQLAIDAVKKFRDAVQANPELKNRPELDTLRKALLNEPLEFFRKLRDQLQSDRDTRPEALWRLASASFDLAGTTAEIGSVPDAIRSYRESLAIYERLARENPSVTKFQSDLAASHNNIGVLQRATGHPDQALESHGKALAIWERLARENPSATEFQGCLALSHYSTGDLQRETGHIGQALESYGKALAIRDRLAREKPRVTAFQRDLATSHYAIGYIQSNTGHPDEALESYGKALAIQERLARENPSGTELRSDLALSHSGIGVLRIRTGHPEEGLESFAKTLAIRERLARGNPSVTEFQSRLGGIHNDMGMLQSDTGHPDQALDSYGKALVIRDRLARENPSVTAFQRDLAISHYGIGVVQSNTGLPDQAFESYTKALAIFERLAREHPQSAHDASLLACLLNNMAMIDLGAKHFDQARGRMQQAISLQKKALAANPNYPAYRQALLTHLKNLIKAAKALGKADEASEAQDALNELAANNPAKAALNQRLAGARTAAHGPAPLPLDRRPESRTMRACPLSP